MVVDEGGNRPDLVNPCQFSHNSSGNGAENMAFVGGPVFRTRKKETPPCGGVS